MKNEPVGLKGLNFLIYREFGYQAVDSDRWMAQGAASSIRNIDIKRGSFVKLTGCSDDAIVVLHDFLYNRQPDPRAAIYFFAMKFLEYAENKFSELGFEADAIVLDSDVAVDFSGGKLIVDLFVSFYYSAFDDDVRWYLRVWEFEGVADKIIHELTKLKSDNVRST